jgi:hypothetical protein
MAGPPPVIGKLYAFAEGGFKRPESDEAKPGCVAVTLTIE